MRRRFLLALGLLGVSLLTALPVDAALPRGIESGPTSCTDPAWTSSRPGEVYRPDGRYVLHNNMWNANGYYVSQRMGGCDHGSWYVEDMVPEPTDTAVKSYPNVHVDFHDWSTAYEPPLSSFSTIISSYGGHGAGIGVYDVTFDIWLNGVATPGSNEVMIWTDNRGQRPTGSVVASAVEISDRTWDVWATADSGYVAFVPSDGRSYPAGTLDLRAFLHYLIGKGRLPGRSTLGQVGYGVEVISTDGRTARFTCTAFSLITR